MCWAVDKKTFCRVQSFAYEAQNVFVEPKQMDEKSTNMYTNAGQYVASHILILIHCRSFRGMS